MNDPQARLRDWSVEQAFHVQMHAIHDAALKLKPRCRLTALRELIIARGGVGAADHLLATDDPAGGLRELHQRGADAIRLSVEYLVLQHPWCTLFSTEQRETARGRLLAVGLDVPIAPAPRANMDSSVQISGASSTTSRALNLMKSTAGVSPDPNLFIVEVDGFNGELASISVTGAHGAPLRAVYCIARRDPKSGVLHFVDYGYPSLSEAREAWPHAS